MKSISKYLMFYCLTILLAGCAGNKKLPEVETITVKRNNINATILATGIIKSKIGAEVRVGSRVSGIVKRQFVKNGDEVRRGDLLAILDDSELSARNRIELADLYNYATVAKYAKIEMDRSKSLNDKDFTSKQAYDDLVKSYEIALARLSSQKAAVDYSSAQLGFTKIYAPISGVIGSVSTQEGETVSAAFTSPTFVTIIDLTRIEVWTYVDETDIGRVEQGQKVSFTVDTYGGSVFEGSISAIYPKAEIRDNVVNYIAIVELSDKKGKILRPEMTASVTIQTSPANMVLSIPNNIIRRENTETVVYILNNGKPEMKKIKTGLKGTQLTEIVEGLQENDQVVLNVDDILKK